MEIRKVTQADLDDLVRLSDQILRQHAEQYPQVFRYPAGQDDVREFFAQLISGDDKTVILATNGQALGYLFFERQHTRESIFKHARTRYYIHHVVVDERVRRSGTASALFDWVETDARANGISQIALDTWMLNQGAHQFFEQRGFEVMQLLLLKSVG